MDEDVRKAEASAAAANAIKTECEEALAEALPILVSVGFILILLRCAGGDVNRMAV